MVSKISFYFLAALLISTSFEASFSQVINYETKVTVDGRGKKTTKKTILVQVNNKQENWLSQIKLRHNPKQSFSFGYAQIVDRNGEIVRKLKKKELKTRNELSYQAFYQDDLITEFDLYWNQYPYKVEYSYTIEEEEYLYIAGWSPLLYAKVPTMESSLEVDLPARYEVNISSSGEVTFEEKALETEDRKILNWRSSDVKKPRDEIHSLPLENLIPIVMVAPIEFTYGVPGNQDSWSTFGFWLDRLNEGTDQLPLKEKWTVEKLVFGVEDEKEVVKKLYHYLQDHTKYVNVAIDVGGLKSYPASYVCDNKYGDCKALTTYMKSLLRSVGIESFYTVIKAGENEKNINPEFPGQQFNHVVLMVPSGKDTLWLENTSSALPFNYTGTFTQNRYALAVKEKESQLVKTPELLPEDMLLEREYSFQFPNNGQPEIKLALKLRGKEFEDFRYYIYEKDLKQQNEEVLKNTGIGGLHTVEWSLMDFQRDSTFVDIELKGRSPSVIREIGSFKVINPLRIVLPDFEKPEERKLDVSIPYPINRSDKSLYILNHIESGELQMPENIVIESDYGQYSVTYSKEDGDVLVDEKFTLYANEIPIENYSELYSFLQSIINHKKKSAILIK